MDCLGGEHAEPAVVIPHGDPVILAGEQRRERILQGAVRRDRGNVRVGRRLADAHGREGQHGGGVDRGDAEPPQRPVAADEARHELVRRGGEQRAGRGVLLDMRAGGQHRDPVGQPHGLIDVVGDHHDGLAHPPLQR